MFPDVIDNQSLSHTATAHESRLFELRGNANIGIIIVLNSVKAAVSKTSSADIWYRTEAKGLWY